MKPRRIATGALGLLACSVLAIPLAQRFSVDLMQLQLRSKFIDDRQSFGRVATTFGMSPTALAGAIGLGPVDSTQAAQSLARLASDRGMPVDVAKQRIAEAVIPRQFAGKSILSGIGLGPQERGNVAPH